MCVASGITFRVTFSNGYVENYEASTIEELQLVMEERITDMEPDFDWLHEIKVISIIPAIDEGETDGKQ